MQSVRAVFFKVRVQRRFESSVNICPSDALNPLRSNLHGICVVSPADSGNLFPGKIVWCLFPFYTLFFVVVVWICLLALCSSLIHFCHMLFTYLLATFFLHLNITQLCICMSILEM